MLTSTTMHIINVHDQNTNEQHTSRKHTKYSIIMQSTQAAKKQKTTMAVDLESLKCSSWDEGCSVLYLGHSELLTLDTRHPTNIKMTITKIQIATKQDSFSKTFDLHTFHKNTSHSHDNLRRVSKSPLLHPFTGSRSGTLD
jgi:hypothetical protein